jgi:sugar O-acyltransferase (sialic acid O-acetyltransferase NeuD family)
MGIVIVGAGGFAKDVFTYLGDVNLGQSQTNVVRGFLATPEPSAQIQSLAPYLGSEHDYTFSPEDRVIVAIGDPAKRRAVTERVAARGAIFMTLIHPRSYVASTAVLGEGCILTPFTFIGPFARVGAHVHVNISGSINHDAVVGDYCTFSPYAAALGGTEVESGVFLGTHATVHPRITVGHNSKIAAGAVVTRSVPPGSLMTGNPAKGHIKYPI